MGVKSKSGKGMIYRRGQVWWLKYYDNGRPRYETSRSTKETDAKRLLSLRLGQVEQGNCPAPEAQKARFEDLALDLENEYRANGRRSLEHLIDRIKHLRRFFGSMRAAAITTSEVQKYIVKRQGEGARNATVNRDLAALRRMFSLAVKATPPKVGRVPYIPMLQEDNARQGFFEHEDFEQVRAALPEHLRPLVTFAYHTGWRKSEVINLKLDQVDLHTATVRLEPGTTKNRQARMIFLAGELLAVIQRQREIRDRHYPDCPWVFFSGGKQIKSFRRSWNTACRKVGLAGKILHDFRRSAIRNMVRAGIPERVAMDLSGHKTRSVFERYNIVSEGDLQEAGRRLTGTITGTIRAQQGSEAN